MSGHKKAPIKGLGQYSKQYVNHYRQFVVTVLQLVCWLYVTLKQTRRSDSPSESQGTLYMVELPKTARVHWFLSTGFCANICWSHLHHAGGLSQSPNRKSEINNRMIEIDFFIIPKVRHFKVNRLLDSSYDLCQASPSASLSLALSPSPKASAAGESFSEGAWRPKPACSKGVPMGP